MSQYNFWQGRLDNLCGLYCAVYVMRDFENLAKKPSDRPQRALYSLLNAAAAKGKLTAEKLAGSGRGAGFTSGELIEVFNHIKISKTHGYRAHFIRDIYSEYSGDLRIFGELFSAGGYVMFDARKDEHWALAVRLNGNGFAECFDPALDIGISSRQRASSADGVIFAPSAFAIPPK